MFRLLIVLLCLSSSAHAEQLPDGVNCDQIKAMVVEHGKVRAIAWALKNGYSWKQIVQARRQCDIH